MNEFKWDFDWEEEDGNTDILSLCKSMVERYSNHFSNHFSISEKEKELMASESYELFNKYYKGNGSIERYLTVVVKNFYYNRKYHYGD